MEKYLTYLIEDMHQAAQRVPLSKIPEGDFDPDYMLELEESPDRKMSDWFGLSIDQFPKSDRLTLSQLETMADEFENLWMAFSFVPEFPEKLPSKRRYELMREYLEEKCQHWPGGWKQHFEFCNYDVEKCPFGSKYCKCKDFQFDKYEAMNDNLPADEIPY